MSKPASMIQIVQNNLQRLTPKSGQVINMLINSVIKLDKVKMTPQNESTSF